MLFPITVLRQHIENCLVDSQGLSPVKLPASVRVLHPLFLAFRTKAEATVAKENGMQGTYLILTLALLL